MGMRMRMGHPVTAWELLATGLRNFGGRGRGRLFNVAYARCEMSGRATEWGDSLAAQRTRPCRR